MHEDINSICVILNVFVCDDVTCLCYVLCALWIKVSW